MHALQDADIGTPIEFELGDRLPPMQMARYCGDTRLPFGLYVPPNRVGRAAGGGPGPSDVADSAASVFMTIDSAAIVEDADPEDTCGGVIVGGGKDGKDARERQLNRQEQVWDNRCEVVEIV
tara:strand:+ start:65 stop:430 length:366 start_codon:yes stop_codon:yes gene_type:complete